MKRFTCYATIGGDLKHCAVAQSDLQKAFRDAKAHSVRHGEAWLYDAATDKMLARFVHGVLTQETAQRRIADSVEYVAQGPKINPRVPRYEGFVGVIDETITGGARIRSVGTFPTVNQARIAAEKEAKRIIKSGQMAYALEPKPIIHHENPKFRLGQRRVYPVKGKRAARYKGSLPSRQTTFTSKRKALAASNPRGVKIYGNLIRIEAQKTQKHLCDAACKKADHRYFHDFTSHPSIYGMPDGSLIIR